MLVASLRGVTGHARLDVVAERRQAPLTGKASTPVMPPVKAPPVVEGDRLAGVPRAPGGRPGSDRRPAGPRSAASPNASVAGRSSRARQEPTQERMRSRCDAGRCGSPGENHVPRRPSASSSSETSQARQRPGSRLHRPPWVAFQFGVYEADNPPEGRPASGRSDFRGAGRSVPGPGVSGVSAREEFSVGRHDYHFVRKPGILGLFMRPWVVAALAWGGVLGRHGHTISSNSIIRHDHPVCICMTSALSLGVTVYIRLRFLVAEASGALSTGT
jgi:hypothetical protein